MGIPVLARMAVWFRLFTVVIGLILSAAPVSARDNPLQKLSKALNSPGHSQSAGNLIVNGSFEEPVEPPQTAQ